MGAIDKLLKKKQQNFSIVFQHGKMFKATQSGLWPNTNKLFSKKLNLIPQTKKMQPGLMRIVKRYTLIIVLK